MHGIIGLFLGSLFEEQAGPITLLLIVASVLPDIDLVFIMLGRLSYFKHHRKLTHSVFGIPLLAFGLAFVFSRLSSLGFWEAYLISILGMSVHIFFDLTNHFGTEVLYPLKKRRYAWEFTNVVEVPLYGLSILFLILTIFFERSDVARLALAMFLIYIALKAALHRVARNAAKRRYGKSRAIPHFWNIFSWHIIHEEKDKYILSDLNILSGKAVRARTFKKAPDSMRKIDRNLSAFFDFAEYPIIEVEEGLIKIKDLRFFATDHFMMILRADASGIISEKFKT